MQANLCEQRSFKKWFKTAISNVFFYLTGILFLALAKIKHILRGYTTPKPFNISNIEKCIDYDFRIVEDWLLYLKKYKGNERFLFGKNVLELGPSSDLGVGLYLLSKGAKKYYACDVHDLVKNTPTSFYKAFFEQLETINSKADIVFLKDQLSKAREGASSQLTYLVSNNFDLVSNIGKNKIDLVFSQAAFEHFDNVEATVTQLTEVCRRGAVLIAVIDLKTHSRWIRDKDPNNIYRYNDKIYRMFWFRGAPNRVRPYKYQEIFKQHGWADVVIMPLSRLNHPKHKSSLSKQFRDSINQMDFLSVVLCATKR